MSLSMSQSDTEEVAQAEAEVALKKAELARSLRAVGHSGEVMARRIGSELKPTAVAVAVVAGAIAIVGVGVFVARRRRHHWLVPEPPSAFATAAKAAGLWALRLLARRAAQEIASRLGEPATTSRLVAPAPNQIQS